MKYHYSLGVYGDYEYALLKPGPNTRWGYMVRYPKTAPYLNYREDYVGGSWESPDDRKGQRKTQREPQRFDAETAKAELAMLAIGDSL